MLLPALVLLLPSLCNTAEISKRHVETLFPRAQNTSIPTITLLPVTDFDQSLPDGLSVTATGTQIQLITDAPSLKGDALLVLGEDAAENLNSTYGEFCQNGLDSPNCRVSLEANMKIDQEGIEKRFVPVIFAAVVAAGMAVEYVQMRQHEKAISRIRAPSANVANMVAVESSSIVVLATQTGGGDLITVVPSPTGVEVAVATASAGSDGAGKNDLIFTWPINEGFEFSSLVKMFGPCLESRKRGCTPGTRAGYVAGKAIQQMGPMGVFQDLIIPTHLSLPDLIPDLAKQLQQVVELGRQITRLVGDMVTVAAKWFLMAAWAELTTTTTNPTRIVIPASIITTSESPQESGSNRCPAYTPNCSNCGGNQNSSSDPLDTAGICRSLPGCVCVDAKDPPPYQRSFVTANPLTSSQIQQNGQYSFNFTQTLGVVGKDMAPSINWSVGDNLGNIQVSDVVTTQSFTVPVSPGTLLVQWTGDPTSKTTAGLRFTFTDSFQNTFDWAETNNDAKFNCSQPGPYVQADTDGPFTRTLKCHLRAWPSADDDKYRIEITQQMHDVWSQVLYTLYTYTLGEQISDKDAVLRGGVAKGVDGPGNPLSGQVGIFVKDPTNIKSLLQFSRNRVKFYSVDDVRNSVNGMYYCNQTEARDWIPWNGGFTRTFNCPFLGAGT